MNPCPECKIVFGPVCTKHPLPPDKDGWVTITQANYKTILEKLQKLVDE